MVIVGRRRFNTLTLGGTAFVSSWERVGFIPVLRVAAKIVRLDEEQPLSLRFAEKKPRGALIAKGFSRKRIGVMRKNTFTKQETVDEPLESPLLLFAKALESWSDPEKARLWECIKSNMTEEHKQTTSFGMEQ